MKVYPNDYSTITVREKKMNNIYKKTNNFSQNKKRITSPIIKSNKTIQKYINERLNTIKKINTIYIKEEFQIEKHPQKMNYKNHPNLIKNKIIISPKQRHSQKYIKVIKKNKKNREKKVEENFSLNKDKENNNNNDKYNSIDRSTKSINILYQKKQNSKESKLINSISTSSGLSFHSIENKNNCNNHQRNFNNNGFYKYNDDLRLIYKNNYINDNDTNKRLLEESNQIKPNINNFNYESGSEDNLSENKIFLKCDNYSLLTFGNSFSYSNSKRSKSTKKNDNNEEKKDSYNNNNYKICSKDLIFNNYYNKSNNNISINRLKEENETLKRELKQSNEQINFLMCQIKELKQNKNYHSKKLLRNNKMRSPIIWNHKNIKFSSIEHVNNKIKNHNKNIYINCENNELYDEEKENIRFNKDVLKGITKTINEKNYFKNYKKKINIKKNLNLNLNSKIIKKVQNKDNSPCLFDKPIENLNKCISKLKI